MEKAKIIFFKFSLAFGGGEKHNIVLGKGLKEDGNKIKIYTNNKRFLEKISESGLEGRHLYWGMEVGARRNIPSYFFRLPFELIRFYFLLKKEGEVGLNNVAVFQSLNEKIFASRMASRMGFKVLWLEHLSVDPWLTKSTFRKSYVKSSKYASKIIVISEIIKKELLEIIEIPKEKVGVIYNGVEVDRFLNITAEDVKKFRGEVGLDDSLVIGSAGRLHKEKGFDVLIKAFKVARGNLEDLDLKLVFAGDGPEMVNLKKIAEDLGIASSVLFLGFRSDVPLIMNAIDVFVLPSKVRESFGIVLIESMACKKVVIASNLGGIPEIIDSGKNGLLFDPGSEKDLANNIVKVLEDKSLYKKISEEAFKTVKERFSSEKMVEEFELLFKRM